MRASARWGSPMSYAIRIWSLAGYEAGEGPPPGGSFLLCGGGAGGRYLASYDPDGNSGFGDLALTTDPARAKRYPSTTAAAEDYRRRSTVLPTRPDGEPNRPLTAYTVEIITVE